MSDTPSGSIDALYQRVQAAVGGQYAIMRLLGHGGMGAVYLARDLELDRLVALKVLPPDASDTGERKARFRREAQLAAKLTHPNIVPLHSFGENDGLMYYVMGYVRGESLATRLRREGRIGADETRNTLAQLADALAYAHGKGVIHRDIKPDNILLDDETGQPLLADFGIAKASGPGGTLTEAGGIVGTLHYMSPEQATGAALIDNRSDLYSLGVVGYVMLSGQTPFDSKSFSHFVAQQASAEAPTLASRLPELAADLNAAIMRCLARDANARWNDARAFQQSLGATLEEDSERLPGELREVAGGLFWSVVMGWIAANTLFAVVPARFRSWIATVAAALMPAMIFVVTAAVHIRKGFTWAEMRRVAVWPTPWWPFWWPATWRRPGDLWHRLPRTVRGVRLVYGIIASALLVALPLAFRQSTQPIFAVVFGAAWLAVTATMLYCAWWAHRSGIPNNADLRSLFLRSTSDRRFWKRPQLAKRLLPVGSGADRSPKTPAEYVRNIVVDTQRMTGPAREIGLKTAEVARLACSALDALDRETATVSIDGDNQGASTQREAVTDRRARIAKGLDTLWREHLRVLRENADTSTLVVAARALEQDLRPDGLPLDASNAATVGPATSDLTVPHRS